MFPSVEECDLVCFQILILIALGNYVRKHNFVFLQSNHERHLSFPNKLTMCQIKVSTALFFECCLVEKLSLQLFLSLVRISNIKKPFQFSKVFFVCFLFSLVQ